MKKKNMVCMGFKPAAAGTNGWKTQTNTLSYHRPPIGSNKFGWHCTWVLVILRYLYPPLEGPSSTKSSNYFGQKAIRWTNWFFERSSSWAFIELLYCFSGKGDFNYNDRPIPNPLDREWLKLPTKCTNESGQQLKEIHLREYYIKKHPTS